MDVLKYPVTIYQESNKKLPNSNVRKIHVYGGKKNIVGIEKANKQLPQAIKPNPSIKIKFMDGSTVYISYFRNELMRDIAYNKILQASQTSKNIIELRYEKYFKYYGKIDDKTAQKILRIDPDIEELKVLKKQLDRLESFRHTLDIEAFKNHRLWGKNGFVNQEILVDLIENVDIPEKFKNKVPKDIFWKLYFKDKKS